MFRSCKSNGILSRTVTILMTVVLFATLIIPATCDPSSAASGGLTFSKKEVINAKLLPIMSGDYKMNLRLEANQQVFGYDTIQGTCYGHGYMYYLLINKINNRCRIVKMRFRDKKVVKVSKPLNVNHGNDMTYNYNKKRILVCHGKPVGKKISVIKPGNLTIEKNVIVELPKNLKGVPWKRVKKKGGYKGFNNIAYNNKHRRYVVQLYGSRDFLMLNEKFVPVKYVQPTKWDSQVYQGMDSYGDRIIVCNSFKSGKPYNVLSVYDWKGNYLSRVVLNRGEELESIFHTKTALYVSYYRMYHRKYRWVLKEKAVPGKSPIRIYKKKKYDRFVTNKDNNFYRLTNL